MQHTLHRGLPADSAYGSVAGFEMSICGTLTWSSDTVRSFRTKRYHGYHPPFFESIYLLVLFSLADVNCPSPLQIKKEESPILEFFYKKTGTVIKTEKDY